MGEATRGKKETRQLPAAPRRLRTSGAGDRGRRSWGGLSCSPRSARRTPAASRTRRPGGLTVGQSLALSPALVNRDGDCPADVLGSHVKDQRRRICASTFSASSQA